MKTMLKVTLLFVLVTCANTLFATGNLKVNIIPLKNEKAIVAVTSLSNTSFKMTLTDEKNRTVFYKENTDQSENYSKVYNFSDLEDGRYKLTVVADGLTTERSFQKNRGKIEVGEEKTTLEPFFGYNDGILKYSYLNFQKDNLRLYFYEKNHLIYTRDIGRIFNVTQALNLSKLRKGHYEVVLTTEDKSFSYPVNIQ